MSLLTQILILGQFFSFFFHTLVTNDVPQIYLNDSKEGKSILKKKSKFILWNLPRNLYNTLDQSANGVVYFIELSQHFMKTLHNIFDYWKLEIHESRLLEWGLGFFHRFCGFEILKKNSKFFILKIYLHQKYSKKYLKFVLVTM